jgi:two-component system LytT family response regulator
MPNGNGFDLLKLFKKPDFRVIFVTAYSEYAIRAFRFSAVDYLLKPVKVDELIEAVEKVREIVLDGKETPDLQTLQENLSPRNGISRLVVSDLKGFTVIRTDQIIKCEGEGYCTHFYLTGGKKVTSSKNLKYYEELFDHTQIIRVHHSSLINLDHLEGYTRQGEIVLAEGLKCPLGDKYKQVFMGRFGKGK